MEMKNDNLTFQVLFWSLIGPFICLLSLFVFYIKGDATPDFLPAIFLIGVPLCWKWKLQGFAASAILLFLLLTYYYFSIPLEERFWHLGMGISIAMSLLITALSFEEVETLIEGMKLESRSRLENLWKVDEKLQQAVGEIKKKKERIRESGIKIASYQKLLDRSAEELVDLRDKLEKAKEEFYQVSKDKEELLLSVSHMRNEMPAEGKYQQLRYQYEEAERQLQLYREQIHNLQKEREETKMYELTEIEEALEKQLFKTEKEREQSDTEHQQELDALQDVLTSALRKE